MDCDFCRIELKPSAPPKEQFTLFKHFINWLYRDEHYYLRCPKCGKIYCSKCGLIDCGRDKL